MSVTVPSDEALLAAAIEKEGRLQELLAGYGSIVIAYSGGVDSTYLADVAHDALGADARVLMGDSASLPRSEKDEAIAIARERGWNLEIIPTEEFDQEDYLRNDGTRCYHCRTELFTKMQRFAERSGIKTLAYGAIVDDLLDPTRLGAKAASERRVVAPLQEAELSKAEIRILSARRNLPTADKASFACLSSRFPKGTRVTKEDIARVEAAEETLKQLGFRQYRARHHGDLCRIEIDATDLPKLLDDAIRRQVVQAISAVGYRYVTLDLACYRTGSTA